MGDKQVFSKSIERCFNRVMGIYPLQNCFGCIPNEENKSCHKYDAMKIILPVYRGWAEYNKSKPSAIVLKEESVIALKEKYPIVLKK